MDKHELRQDPIRDRILTYLSYIEKNKAALMSIVLGVVLVIFVASYYSKATDELSRKTSVLFGKAMNMTQEGDIESALPVFNEIINTGSENGAANSIVYLIDYYLKDGNILKVDSLLNNDINIKDPVLQSKILSLQGDLSFDRLEYEDAIDYYQKAATINPPRESEMRVKEISVLLASDNYQKAEKILIELLKNESLAYDIKNKCNVYMSIVRNKM